MEELKSQFILAFAENDELAMFFALQKLAQAWKQGDVSIEEFQELVKLIGKEFTFEGKKYVLQ